MASEAHPEIGHIQALLVLVIHHLALGSLSQAWLLIGRAIYIAVDLGLFKTRSSTTLETLDDKTERACLGCFILDTLVALRLERRPYLQTKDLHNNGLSSVNGIEEWELSSSDAPLVPMPARILSSFNSFAAIIRSINDLNSLPPEALDKLRVSSTVQQIQTFYSSFKRTTSTSPQILNILISSVIVILVLWRTASGLLDMSGSPVETMLRDLLKTAIIGLQERDYGQLLPLYNIYLPVFTSLSGTETDRGPNSVPELSELKKKLGEICAVQAKHSARDDGTEEAVRDGANRHPSFINSGSILLDATGRGADALELGDNELYNSLSLLGPSNWTPTLEFLENLGVPHDTISMNDQEFSNAYHMP
ncbi:hypothetical protein F5Y08DRAFT_336499 [Xylaria arbuscula]|nr:hypothetical protein F5Y08DRAFT_336499 [Xylaria arbuscula]